MRAALEAKAHNSINTDRSKAVHMSYLYLLVTVICFGAIFIYCCFLC